MSPAPNDSDPGTPCEPDSGLTVKLPQAITVTEFTVTRDGLGRVLDAATRLYLRSRPTDEASITLQLAMKAAARALLWFMAKKPQAGWTQVPRLTRHDDATAAVIRYMLENFFGEAIRHSGGVIDATAANPRALAAPDTTAAPQGDYQGDYGELVTALAGLVSGPGAGPTRDELSSRGSAAETVGNPVEAGTGTTVAADSAA